LKEDDREIVFESRVKYACSLEFMNGRAKSPLPKKESEAGERKRLVSGKTW
jgi:hypothetical protein